MMRGGLLLAATAGAVTFLLLSYQRIPAMLVLLGLGIGVAVAREPTLLAELSRLSVHFRWPTSGLAQIGWSDLATGILVLGLPQLPLTLGNAIISTVEENNTHFPDRPITVKAVAMDHAALNLVGTALGGVPMCHGAGGMAGHIRFGAKTGGALVILGSLVLFVGLFLADSVATLFKCFPPVILGVILLFGGPGVGSWGAGRGEQQRGPLHHLPDGWLGDVEHGRGVPRGPAARHCLRAEVGDALILFQRGRLDRNRQAREDSCSIGGPGERHPCCAQGSEWADMLSWWEELSSVCSRSAQISAQGVSTGGRNSCGPQQASRPSACANCGCGCGSVGKRSASRDGGHARWCAPLALPRAPAGTAPLRLVSSPCYPLRYIPPNRPKV